MRNVFTKDALERLHSLEKLDEMLRITTPISWVGLLMTGMLVISAVFWSIFGSIVVKVEGTGIIMDHGGVVRPVVRGSGNIKKVYVIEGSQVKEGDLLAELEILDVDNDGRIARNDISLSDSKKEALGKVEQYSTTGLKKNSTAQVISDTDGIVTEVFVKKGDMASVGREICAIRCIDGNKEKNGVLYVSARMGKKIVPGMTLQLTPSGTDSSVDGYLMAVVRRVSEYPVTQESINSRIGNPALAMAIMQTNGSACMEVFFDILKDRNNPTGYLWTSVVGNPAPISAGSMVTGFAVVERIPPIEKVFYKFSNWVRTR